jgi:hypothetical protein
MNSENTGYSTVVIVLIYGTARTLVATGKLTCCLSLGVTDRRS